MKNEINFFVSVRMGKEGLIKEKIYQNRERGNGESEDKKLTNNVKGANVI